VEAEAAGGGMVSGEAAGRPALTDEEQESRRQAMPALFLGTPFLATLGLVVERYQPDDVEIRLPFRHELSNDGRTYHGGVVATMLDTAGALAAWSNHDFDRGVRAATVAMSVQYLAASDRTDLHCRAKAIRRARELIFTEMTATDPGGRILAQGLQTYRIT